jgi:hypothetical protein
MGRACRISVRKSERSLGRPKCKWEDNIKMDLKEIAWEDVQCINLAQDGDKWRAVVNMVMNIGVV